MPRGNTVASSDFSSDAFFERWALKEIGPPVGSDLESSIREAFAIKTNDSYVYHATASVTLSQVQQAIGHGGQHRLHAWYIDEDGKQIAPPPTTDIDAYTSVFASNTSTSKALTSLEKNAKKDSIRSHVAKNLLHQRHFPSTIPIPKLKTTQINPYLDYWRWSCHNLEWAGPDQSTVNVRQSHHILPIFYHHFGCVCPSFEALETIKQLAKSRAIVEIGSGNGYWAYLLRRMGLNVHAVDNGDSLWRTIWLDDTLKMDGAKYLDVNQGAKDAVLLLVYPQVSTSFTTSVLKAFRGGTICIAGTQNANGYTAFKDITIDRYIATEMSEFVKIVQTPLPSFAAKDEALFVFHRKAVVPAKIPS